MEAAGVLLMGLDHNRHCADSQHENRHTADLQWMDTEAGTLALRHAARASGVSVQSLMERIMSGSRRSADE